MKKLAALILVLLMLASALSVTAFAGGGAPKDEPETEATTEVTPEEDVVPDLTPVAPPAEGVVLSVRAKKNAGGKDEFVDIASFTSFAEGWSKAMELAGNEETMKANNYARIIVDFYADWKANEKGEFGSGTGFGWSTLEIPDNASVTLNLNGYTINRDLKTYELDGEVLCILSQAYVIINNGVITGGWSQNGAGGIHIKSKAIVMLNNVYVMGNKADDDKGAGIAAYSGARVTMKGGAIYNNTLYATSGSVEAAEGGALYLEGATAKLEGVTISGNNITENEAHGIAASLDSGSYLTLDNCVVKNNTADENSKGATLFFLFDNASVLEIKNGTKILNNGTHFRYDDEGKKSYPKYSALFYISGTLLMSDSFVEENSFCTFFLMPYGTSQSIQILNTRFLNNNSDAYCCSDNLSGGSIVFSDCKFNNNKSNWTTNSSKTFFLDPRINVLFKNCDLGDTTFDKCEYIQIVKGDELSGSILSQGSWTAILSLAALVISLATFGFVVISNKKSAALAAASKTEEQDA